MRNVYLLKRIALRAILISAGLLSISPAQAQNSVTQVSSSPAGATFNVDGQNYTQAVSAAWPAGSKHVLSVQGTSQVANLGEILVFKEWQWAQGTFTDTQITITSDPAITSYTAVFTATYALNVVFYACGGPLPGPGTIYVNGAATQCDEQVYFPAGSPVIVQAIPNNGYVFVGWYSTINQTVVGFQSTVTLNSPTTISPHFAPARNISFTSSPPGLQVIADYATITTPYTLQWGFDTVHSVGPISPQMDSTGNPWIFSSWSDGGAPIHAYTVAESTTPAQMVATYNPAVGATFQTSPPQLNLTVDGSSSTPPYNFYWGVGETHTFSAPAQQTDATGHVWTFSGWSNGGPAAQSVTVPASAVGVGIRMVATYVPTGHLIVNSTVSGVTVTVNGTSCATPCDLKQAVGSQIDVGAPPVVNQTGTTRQSFSGWTGGSTGGPSDLMVTLTSDPITVYANYNVMNYLSVTASPASAATFTMQPSSPDGFYATNATVIVTAAPQPGYKFQSWSGDLAGANTSGSVSMNSPRTLLATLTKSPYVGPTAVENGAGSTPVTAVAPGSIVSIFGANLAAGTSVSAASPLPQTLGGVSVMLGNSLLPLFFVSPAQINLQLPNGVAPGSANLTIIAAGLPNVTTGLTITQDAPGLFQQAVNNQSFALAFHADGTLVTQAAPAIIGELLTLYGTGFGATNPTRLEGFSIPASPVYNLVDPVSLAIGGDTLSPSAGFALPGSVGIDAVQFTLADRTQSGTTVPLSLTINGQQSNTVMLPVK
jgi:uncharacterized protein (TIGR03437 family)